MDKTYIVKATSQAEEQIQEIHRLPVKNFLVYFWIDEDKMKVQITAVIYGKRDQLRQLSQIEME